MSFNSFSFIIITFQLPKWEGLLMGNLFKRPKAVVVVSLVTDQEITLQQSQFSFGLNKVCYQSIYKKKSLLVPVMEELFYFKNFFSNRKLTFTTGHRPH